MRPKLCMKRSGRIRPIPTRYLLECRHGTPVGVAKRAGIGLCSAQESAPGALARIGTLLWNARRRRTSGQRAPGVYCRRRLATFPLFLHLIFGDTTMTEKLTEQDHREKSPRPMPSGSSSSLRSSTRWPAPAAPSPLSPASIGTSTTTGPTTASAAARCCLARKQNLIRERDGPASLRPPTARTSRAHRHQLWHDAHRGTLRQVRCAFGPRVSGWTRTNRTALLHELGVARL
jgi:hypothetical protein